MLRLEENARSQNGNIWAEDPKLHEVMGIDRIQMKKMKKLMKRMEANAEKSIEEKLSDSNRESSEDSFWENPKTKVIGVTTEDHGLQVQETK